MLKNKKNIVIIVVLTLVVIIGVVIGISVFHGSQGGPEGEQNQTDQGNTEQNNTEQDQIDLPELQIISTAEVEDLVVVESTYGTFHYPFAFSDIIGVKTINQETSSKLQFFARIDGEEVVIYTIHYNDAVGDRCGTLRLEDNAEVEVFVEFTDAPTSLSSGWLTTFYATQETFNDVLFSMSDDGQFVIAE